MEMSGRDVLKQKPKMSGEERKEFRAWQNSSLSEPLLSEVEYKAVRTMNGNHPISQRDFESMEIRRKLIGSYVKTILGGVDLGGGRTYDLPGARDTRPDLVEMVTSHIGPERAKQFRAEYENIFLFSELAKFTDEEVGVMGDEARDIWKRPRPEAAS